MSYDLTHAAKLKHLKDLALRSKQEFASKSEFATLSGKVTALENVGAQANVLEGVQVNGTALAIAEKMVNILVATGTTNGTIKVNGVDVSVAGLAALAYKANVSAEDLSAALAATINAKADSADLATLGGKVDVLIGSVEGDGSKSVRAISAEEVAKVVAQAPTSYDTLKEIADWILNDTTGAAAMANDIAALKTKLTLGTHEVDGQQVEYATVKAYVEAVVSGFISLTALSTQDSGTGNAVTGVSYNSATGVFTVTKGNMVTPVVPAAAGNLATLSANGQLQDSGVALVYATDAEVTEMLNEVFATANS